MNKISSREKMLLIVLVIAFVCAFYYYFAFKPQLDRLIIIRQEITKQEDDIAGVEKQTAEISKINKSIEDTKKLIATKSTKYYPEILQDRLILQVDTLSQKAMLSFPSIVFAPVKISAIESKTAQSSSNASNPSTSNVYPLKEFATAAAPSPSPAVTTTPQSTSQPSSVQNQTAICETLSITMSFKGSYDQLMKFIKELEALNKSTLLTSMTASYANGELTGTINLNFYAIPKLQAQDEMYMNWTYTGSYGKINPFVK